MTLDLSLGTKEKTEHLLITLGFSLGMRSEETYKNLRIFNQFSKSLIQLSLAVLFLRIPNPWLPFS